MGVRDRGNVTGACLNETRAQQPRAGRRAGVERKPARRGSGCKGNSGNHGCTLREACGAVIQEMNGARSIDS